MSASFRSTLFRVAGPPGAATVTDGELVRRFQNESDQDSFAELVRRHGPMVFGVCRRMLPCREEAEDAFQATFLVLAVKPDAVRPPERVGAWLHGVAYRAALKARRTAARRTEAERVAIELRQPPQPPDPDLLPILDEALLALPEKYRLPVVECHLAGRSRKEAAARLGCSEGTLSGRLARALELLAARLTRRGVVLPAVALAGVLTRPLAAAVPANLTASTLSVANLIQEGILPATGLAATLTRGVLNAMWWKKLTALSTLGLAVGMLVASFAFLDAKRATADPPLPNPSRLIERPLLVAAPVPKFAPKWDVKHTLVGERPVVEIVALKETVLFADDRGNISWWKLGNKEAEVLVNGSKSWGHPRPKGAWHSVAHLIYTEGVLSYVVDENVACRYDLLARIPVVLFGAGQLDAYLGFSDNGKTWIEVGGEKKSVVRLRTNIWVDRDAQSEEMRFDAAVTHVVFVPEATSLAAITDDGKIHIINRKELKIVRSIEVKNLRAKAIRFSPDGESLAVVGENGFARLYDATTGRLAAELKGLKGTIFDVAFSPDGKTIATAGEDHTVRLWDAKTGEPLAVLKDHKDSVRVVRFGQDGTTLVTGSDDKTLKVWELKK